MLKHAEKVIVTCMLAFVFGVVGIGVAGTALAETSPVAVTAEVKTTDQQIEMLLKMIQELQKQVLELKAKQGGQTLTPTVPLEKMTNVPEMENKIMPYPGANNPTASSTAKCIAINRYLSSNPGQNTDGADGEVRRLQQFLKEQGLFNEEPTGFFGPATEIAVQKFQEKEGIVKEGRPETTGFGAVGPSTRIMIQKRICGEVFYRADLKPVLIKPDPVLKKVPAEIIKKEPVSAVQKITIPVKVSESAVVSGKMVSVGVGRVEGVDSYRYIVRCEKGAVATRNGVAVCGQVSEWSISTDVNTYFEYQLTNTTNTPVPVYFEVQVYKAGVITGKGVGGVKVLPVTSSSSTGPEANSI